MENQTIIVKKIKKGGHGHHGGAWKVAFADFAVAMMAFFLLLWLIASTTKEEQAGLSEYFSPPTQGLADGSGSSEDIIDMGGGQKISQGDDSKQDAREPTVDEIREVIEAERKQLESLLQELKMAIEDSEALKPFKDQLLLDITPDGLRIQIVDKEGRPMFDSGGAVLKPYSRTILREIAKVIDKVPNKLSLTGHTDAMKFVSRKGYSNWELSVDRANASRRELIAGGYDVAKIAEVVGLASMVPFDKENPRAPINRRIAIVVLNKAAEAALLHPAQTASDGGETQALLDSNGEGGHGVPLRRFRSAIGDLRVQQIAEREAAERTAVESGHEPVAIPVMEPISKSKSVQIHETADDSSHEVPGERKKTVIEYKKPGKKSVSAEDLAEPDYTGMSIAERIKARAEWNKRRAEAAKR